MKKETVMYTYDHQNRMTRRNSELFVHDGWQIVLTLDAKGNVKDRNLWGANQDELIAVNDQFTLCDHLGSVRDIVNADGKVVNHIEYNAFGKVTKQTGKSGCVFGYTGKMFDDATALQWNINRWYDAEVGRWISEDPIGFEGRDMNLARYVNNSTADRLDPTGLQGRGCICERKKKALEKLYRRQLAVCLISAGVLGVVCLLVFTPVGSGVIGGVAGAGCYASYEVDMEIMEYRYEECLITGVWPA
jgi:RHS repeat-associated protein